jgi:hypothetical protein
VSNCIPCPFVFENHQIRTFTGDDGKPWFVAKDICGALSIPWRGADTLRSIPEGWRGFRKFRATNEPAWNGLRGDVAVIAEPAVYKLAFSSRKAEAFAAWIASEALPGIRGDALSESSLQAGGQSASCKTGPSGNWPRLDGSVQACPKTPAAPDGSGRFDPRAGWARCEGSDEPAGKDRRDPDDLRAAAMVNFAVYRPVMSRIEEAARVAGEQLADIEDAVRRAAAAADASDVALDTSLAQKSAGLVCSRADTIRQELRELLGLARLGLAGIATHLELKQARLALGRIEIESCGRFKAPQSLHQFV